MNEESKNSLEIGTVIDGKWVILEFIAKGGMGEVYRAHQIHLKRDVAVKVISEEWLESIADDEEEREIGLKRFRNEMQAMARVRHPHVLQIFDYGTVTVQKNGREVVLEYIAMEYIPGGTLRSTMSEEGFDPEEDLIRSWLDMFFIPVLEGVMAIHELKMAHRDLKPENIMMDGETAKIADFGLAHSYQWEPVTQSIDVKGTPAYMSPEHFFEFDKADHRSDIYSLGKILFEAINGRISPKAKPFKQVHLSNPETPFLQELDEIIRTATAEEREKRYDSVEQLLKVLRDAMDMGKTRQKSTGNIALLGSSFINKPRYIWTGIAFAIVSVAVMAIWHLMGDPGRIELLIDSATEIVKPATPLSRFFLAKDGINMRLISGGDFFQNDGSGDDKQKMLIKSFFMDEKTVSNYHFVEFLNSVKNTLVVQKGVVKQKEKTLLYLGRGKAPYEQIIFQHDRFHLRDTAFAGDPVKRVTWYGAAAYATHYGKRLPTVNEWHYAASINHKEHKAVDSKEQDRSSLPEHQNMHENHMKGQGVGESMSQPEEPKSPDEGTVFQHTIREWAIRSESDLKDGGQTRSISDGEYPSVIVGPRNAVGSNLPGGDFRYPWEGYPDVGFRCVLDVSE